MHKVKSIFWLDRTKVLLDPYEILSSIQIKNLSNSKLKGILFEYYTLTNNIQVYQKANARS